MFTVLSTTRKSNLYLIVALAIALVVILAFIAVPSTAAPKVTVIPMTGASGFPDYFQRHPELSLPAAIKVDQSDYFTRHPEARTPAGLKDLSDYFLRH